MVLGEDSFFDALAHIMWELEVDIFEDERKTLGMAADYAPACKKQLKRLEAMYRCGAMKKIEQAIRAERADMGCDEYAECMWQAADLLRDELQTNEERAVFAVNQIIALWGDDLPELELSEENEDTYEEDDEMIFLQTEGQPQEAEAPQENSESADNGGDNGSQEQGEHVSVLKKLVRFWCETDCEEGRPLLVACPIGWIYMIICALLGGYMVYEVALGDKLTPPVFVFMLILLLSKRFYRYESAGRLSIAVGLFYLAACGRALWLGSAVTLRCLPLIAAALVVFNNGRFSVLLDGEKRRPAAAYPLMLLMSAAVAAGVYAIQRVQL